MACEPAMWRMMIRFAVKASAVTSGYVGIFQKLHENFQQVLISIPGPSSGSAAGLLLCCESPISLSFPRGY